MKIRIIYNFKLLPPSYTAMTIYPFILTGHSFLNSAILKHEMIHVEQVERDGWFRFYLTYLFDFAMNLIRYKNWSDAYFNIPYEVEAYDREHEDLTEKELGKINGRH